MGIRVDYVEGLEGCGYYFRSERRVEVRLGMEPWRMRSVLAHEAAHAELGHEPEEIWCRSQKQERSANAMAGRRLIDHHHMVRLQALGMSEKQMSVELGVARVILRAYLWLSQPSWQQAPEQVAA